MNITTHHHNQYVFCFGSNRFDKVEIVSGCASGADTLGEQFCSEMASNGFDYSLARFPVAWDYFGKTAGMLRNAAMAQYSEYLIAAWDGQSKGTKNMISLAETEQLKTRIINYR